MLLSRGAMLAGTIAVLALALAFTTAAFEASGDEARRVVQDSESAIAASTSLAGSLERAVALTIAGDRAAPAAASTAHVYLDLTRARVAALEQLQPGESLLSSAGRELILVAEEVIDGTREGSPFEAVALVEGRLVDAQRRFERVVTQVGDEGAARKAQAAARAELVTGLAWFFALLAVGILGGVLLAGLTRVPPPAAEASFTAEQPETQRSRQEFMVAVAHELRAALTSLFGLAQLLDEGTFEGQEERQQLTASVYERSAELLRKAENLLVAARADAGMSMCRIEPVDLCAELRDVAETYERGGAPIAIDCPPGYVDADRLRLRQVFRNLLANARSFGGYSITVTGRIDGPHYELTFADNGEGLDGPTEAQLREWLASGGPIYAAGTALGLRMVVLLIDEMGGRLAYGRSEGMTCFSLLLRVHAAVPPAEQAPQPAAVGAPSPDGAIHWDPAPALLQPPRRGPGAVPPGSPAGIRAPAPPSDRPASLPAPVPQRGN